MPRLQKKMSLIILLKQGKRLIKFFWIKKKLIIFGTLTLLSQVLSMVLISKKVR